MHRAVTVPEDDFGFLKLGRSITAQGCFPVPDNHLIFGDTQSVGGIAAQMFIREENDFVALF